MKAGFDDLAARLANVPWGETLAAALWLVLVAVAVLAFMATFAGVTTWVERRIAGRMMSRIGPNRVGPAGFLQWLADGLKCFLKEDVIPDAADRPLFRMAPYLVFAGCFGAFAALPFGYGLAASGIDAGIFYVSAVTSLVVVGILMAGWSSNNKWSLLGGVRGAAQIISYEIPAGLAALSVVALAGTPNLQGIIQAQGGWPWQWFAFHNPFASIAFFVFLASLLAEGNRTPFDLPEAESELVAGYVTEYSGMRFLFFLFAEWANIWVMAALIVTLFLGGWQVPGIAIPAAGAGRTFWILASAAVFFIKTLTFAFVVIWVRWTLPRLRVDQLTDLCWKVFVPTGFVCLIGSSACVLIPGYGAWHAVLQVVQWGLTAAGFGLAAGLLWRARYNIKTLNERIYLKILT